MNKCIISKIFLNIETHPTCGARSEETVPTCEVVPTCEIVPTCEVVPTCDQVKGLFA